jgi:hypothetical protein
MRMCIACRKEPARFKLKVIPVSVCEYIFTNNGYGINGFCDSCTEKIFRSLNKFIAEQGEQGARHGR